MKCDRCGNEFEDSKIHEHHIHPRFMDNKNGIGKKMYLCEKCHNILHLLIPNVVWKYIPAEKKQDCINEVKQFSLEYGKRGESGNTKTI